MSTVNEGTMVEELIPLEVSLPAAPPSSRVRWSKGASSGKRCSSMLKVTLPRKPVPPIRKIFRPLNISVGESLAVIIQ